MAVGKAERCRQQPHLKEPTYAQQQKHHSMRFSCRAQSVLASSNLIFFNMKGVTGILFLTAAPGGAT